MIFKIEIKSLGVDIQTAIAAWDEIYPIPMIADGEKEVPKFASRKEQIEDLLKITLINKLNYALDMVSRKNRVILNKDIFKGE